MNKEKEVFNIWFKSYIKTNPDCWDMADCEKESMFHAWRAAKAQAVPDGFVLVPVRASEKTKQKMLKVFNESDRFLNCENMYKAIIEAQERSDA